MGAQGSGAALKLGSLELSLGEIKMVAVFSRLSRRGLLAVALGIVMLTSQSILLAKTGYATPASTAEYLLELYYNSRERLEGLLNLSESVNVTSSTNITGEACDQLSVVIASAIAAGDELAEQAQAALDAGDEKEAEVLALRAINSLTRAFVLATLCLGLSELENATAAPPVVPPGLMAAILRHEARLNRLRAVVDSAEAAGMNVSEARSLLDQAAEKLQEARELAMARDVVGATQALREANLLMARVVVLLRSASVEGVEARRAAFCKGNLTCIGKILNLTRMPEGLCERLQKRGMSMGVTANLTIPAGPHAGKRPGEVGPPMTPPPFAEEKPGHNETHRHGKPSHPGQGPPPVVPPTGGGEEEG